MDFLALSEVVWRDRWLVAIATLVFMLGGVAYALLARQWFRADVLLIPVSAQPGGGLAGQLGDVSSLAGFIGLGLGARDTTEPLAVLSSREFSADFIKDQKLLPLLFADDWDGVAGRWKSKDPTDWPDTRDGVQYLADNVLDIEEDKKTGLVTLGVDWTDADTAARWASMLVERVNDRMRQRALAESEANVEYLRRELGTTTDVGLQQSIAHLLESELQTLMVAKGRKEYAYRVVDKAVPPKLRDRPKRVLVVAIATLAGGIVAVAFVLMRAAFRRRRAGP